MKNLAVAQFSKKKKINCTFNKLLIKLALFSSKLNSYLIGSGHNGKGQVVYLSPNGVSSI